MTKQPGETNKERYDRELIELLNELKVALPGVQVLFAFLLAVPLSSNFDKVNGFERAIFFATLASTAIATALLIAPSAIHRIDFRNQDKGSMIVLFNKISIYGLVFTAISMVGALTFIADLLYGVYATIFTASVSIVMFSLLWFVLPIRRRQNRGDDERLPL
ncbi:MAG: hypothetical protein HYX29_00260 [Solirubrobacterales bacterium]|nr:hypothetical protein [Solirubrobacterales bacterium]